VTVHPLLARQLRKALPGGAVAPELAALLRAVDEAYTAADEDRRQLERSLFLASDELYARNRRLEQELEERKRLELELQHAEKLRAVGQLAAGVAHEINTPVQFIRDSLSFLGDAFGEVEQLLAAVLDATPPSAALAALADRLDIPFARAEIPRALALSRSGTDRVTAIVRALRVYARADDQTQELADLHHAIHNTLIVVAGEVKHVADLDLELAATRQVRCQVGEIQQVLLNLLVNAAHAIAERHGDSGARGTIRVATRDDGDDVVISISDTGGGIPTVLHGRIFEPFFTTKPVGKGTGQGLSIARALIVDHHGGQLTFETKLGVGTTFVIRLPVAGRPDAAPPRR
jgi:two-component system, NtrC family, sensor kinase